MVTPEGQVKVMDVGLARAAGGSKLTKTGVTLGTVAYMSPEQAQRKSLDRRSDIWSLAVVIYEMVTGRLPFDGEDEQPTLFSIISEAHEPVTALRVGVPTLCVVTLDGATEATAEMVRVESRHSAPP